MMMPSVRLDFVVFKLTPTRTRCDLVITADGKSEKIMTGLLNPFLTHLKSAQEQMEKGGYSITLKPPKNRNVSWFTKGTVQRFVRFVSTPELLERASIIESEIVQIEEAILFQRNNNDTALPTDPQLKTNAGCRPSLSTRRRDENAIVLYKPDGDGFPPPPETDVSDTQDGNSRLQLIKVLALRRSVLQREQEMAFARAVAAGFDVERMAPLISFCKCFGAARMMDACSRFMELWKAKHESGQWREMVESRDPITPDADFASLQACGALTQSGNTPPCQLAPDNNIGSPSGVTDSGKGTTPQDGQQQCAGQISHPMYPPMLSYPQASDEAPIFRPYLNTPFHQNYPGNGWFFQPPQPSVDDWNLHTSQGGGQRKLAMDSRDPNAESEAPQIFQGYYMINDGTCTVASEIKPATRVSKRVSKQRSSTNLSRVHDKDDTVSNHEDGHWQALQSLLLRDADEDDNSARRDMFATEGGGKVEGRRRPAAAAVQRSSEIQIQDGRPIPPNSDADPLVGNDFDTRHYQNKSSSWSMDGDTFIVPPHRPTPSAQDSRRDARTALDMDSEISPKNPSVGTRVKRNYEPCELNLVPSRGTESGVSNFDPALDEVQQHAAKVDTKKKTTNNARTKKGDKIQGVKPDRKAVTAKKGKPTKLITPSEEARARAEKLRSFKADLQKQKKAEEEERVKRLEALKRERRQRIAARSSRDPSSAPAPSMRPLPTKLSPPAFHNKSSKFSDSAAPGSSSPLQRSTPKAISKLSSSDSHNASRPPSGSRVIRSTSSLTGNKVENKGPVSDSKASMARIRRLSEPKDTGAAGVASVKTQSADCLLRRKTFSNGPQTNGSFLVVNLEKKQVLCFSKGKYKDI